MFVIPLGLCQIRYLGCLCFETAHRCHYASWQSFDI